ncbi:MAG: EAL domain-containing protein [Pseudomonadota bacterium]
MFGSSTALIIAIGCIAGIAVVLALWFAARERRLHSELERWHDNVRSVASDASVGHRLNTDVDALVPVSLTVNKLFDAIATKQEALGRRDGDATRLANALQDIVIIHTDRIMFANEAAAALMGVNAMALVDKPVTDLAKPAYRALWDKTTARRLTGEPVPEQQEIQLISADSGSIWVTLTAVLIRFRDQVAVMTIARPVSAATDDDGSAKPTDSLLDHALGAIAECIVTTDAQGIIKTMNSAAAQLLGVLERDAIGVPFARLATLVDEVDHKTLGDPVERCLALRQRVNMGRRALLLRGSGSESISVELSASPIQDDEGDLLGVVVVFHDVSELRGHARRISYQASHDALTGLINRREFEERVSGVLDAVRGAGQRAVLAYLDLDRFKTVNDSCGHQAGDDLLRNVAAIFREQVRDSDLVARIGGDEFAMLLPGCPLAKAQEIADTTCREIADYRFVWQDRIFTIGVSIGLLEIGDSSGSVQDVLAAADSACYVAKRSGRGQVHVYSEADEIVARERGEIRWLQRLQSALKDDRFDLASQPIIALDQGAGNGPACELLLRLRRRHGELVRPAEFLSAAENYQLMPDIDRWVVRAAFDAIANNEIVVPAGRSCSVNLSGQTLSDDAFLDFVVDALDGSSVAPEAICFEMTEEAVYADFTKARRFIEVLHGMGSRFTLDNYGSTPGAFAKLRELPLDYLKIDGRLTRNLVDDEVNQELVASLIRLAEAMRFHTIAEQVEDQNDFDTLRDLGVDFAQGHFVRAPILVGRGSARA